MTKAVNLIRSGVREAKRRRPKEVWREQIIGGSWVRGMGFAWDSTAGVGAVVVGEGTDWWAYFVENTGWRHVASGVGPWFTCGQMAWGDPAKPWLLFAAEGVLPKKWDFTGGGNPEAENLGGDPPKAKYLLVAFERVFLANVAYTVGSTDYTEPNFLYASDIGAPETWPLTTDTGGNPQVGDSTFVEVGTSDDPITGIRLYGANLIIFKRRSVWELHGPEVGQPSQYWRVMKVCDKGCASGSTVVEISGVLYWLSDDGVIAWSGGRPEVISEPVRAALTTTSGVYEPVAGRDDEENYILSFTRAVANTVEDRTLIYNTTDQSWWEWSDWRITGYTAMAYGDTREVHLFGGEGYVWRQNIAPNDRDQLSTDPIATDAIFGPVTGGQNFRNRILRRAYVVVTAAANAQIQLQVSTADRDAAANWPADWFTWTATAPATRLKVDLPIKTGQPNQAYAPRLRVKTVGMVTLHDVGFEWTETEV